MSNKKNSLNILFLPKWYPNKNNPFHGIFVHRHAIAVSKLHNVFVVFAKANDEYQNSLIEKEEIVEDGIQIIRFYYKKKITGLSFVDSLIKSFLYFYCTIKGYGLILNQVKKIDLAHVHVLGRAGLMALYLKKTKTIKFVITEHWSGYLSKINIGWSTRVVMRNASKISVVSDYLKKGLLDNYNSKISIDVIPNVISELLINSTIEKKINSDRKLILHISDLVDESKNISGLIKSIAQLSKIRQDFVLKLVGDGCDSEKFKNLVKEKNIQDFVKFEGEKKQEELIGYFNKSVFLVSFSNYETFGISVLESIAMGTPVVVSNLPTFTNFVTESKGGLLVEKGNENELIERMDNMLSDFDNYNSDELRKYVKENYSSEIVAYQIDQFYKSVKDV